MTARSRDYSHPSLSSFAQVAEAFCNAIANQESSPPDAQLGSIHLLLPQLYASALRLPPTSVLFDEADSSPVEAEGVSPTSEALSVPRFDDLAGFLGLRRYYSEIFDPYAEPTDPAVTGDLLDDLADIYRDVMAGLIEWRKGDGGEALWQWRFSFENHWGEHATSALRALFALSAWHDIPWPTIAW